MTLKNFGLALSVMVVVLLISCGLSPSAPAVTPSPTFASSGPLSAAFTRSTYRLGDTLEFTVRLENNGTTPVTTPVTLTLEGTYDPGITTAIGYRPIPFWSKTQEETLGPGEKRAVTYPIPFDLYRAIGTGHYELSVEALGASVRVETVVMTVFDVQVTYPEQVQTGQTITIPAVITNTADFDAHDVEVYGSGLVSEESLGILPAHSSKTVTFTITVNTSVFISRIFVRSSDGGNIEIASPEIPVTPVPTLTMWVATTPLVSLLDVKVTYPEQMQSGQTVSVQVFVTNKADFDMHDVVVYGFGVPAQSLGTLPAHRSKTATFTFTVPNGNDLDTLIQIKVSVGGTLTTYSRFFPLTPVPTP